MIRLLDLGVCPYLEAWEVQKEVADKVMAGEGDEALILVEHPAVLTLGANFHEENLLLTREQYAERGIDVVRTDRGGDVTYHGPRQLVIYPIFDVSRHGKDLHKWMRDLEETILLALAEFGLEGHRFPPHTGVWVQHRKAAAIGVKIRRWTSLHGIALNCDNDLSPFQLIIPCGISDYPVTSLSRECGRPVTVEEAKGPVIRGFEKVFGQAISG